MAYDIITPFGPKAVGVVSDAERMASQRRALQEALAGQGGGGGRGAQEGADPFFSESGPFGIPPKETGAIDLKARNEAVDARQQATRMVEDGAAIARGYVPGYERQLNQEKGENAIKQERQQQALRDMLNQRVGKAMGGMGGAPAVAAPAKPRVVNPLVGQGNESMGAQAPAARGGMSEDELFELQMLASLANGGAAPDIAGAMNKRSERDQSAQKFALDIEAKKLAIEEAKRATAAEQAKARIAAGQARPGDAAAAPLPAIEEFIPQSGLSGDLAKMTTDFAERDTAVVGWNPTQQDITRIVTERDRLMGALTKRGYDPETAKREANRIIDQNLGSDRNDVNAGWIKKLLETL